jgi:MtrB/PioB family decaheme-associated outer membrane protein
MGFGSPANQYYEILEPVEHTIHDVRFRATLARETWQLQVGYMFSMFENSLTSVTASNPCRSSAGGVCAGSDGNAAAPITGRTSLAPSNTAHTFSVAGGVSLPMRTRITGNLSYSLHIQDDAFLPHTIGGANNTPALVSPALALPKESLDGMVGVLLLNLNATSRPIAPLTLSLKYRLFDYNDMSDEVTFPGHVINDRSLVVEDRTAGRWSYTRHNVDLAARWRFTSPLAVTVGGGWERWDRNEHREVPRSDEWFGKALVDWTPTDWFLARLSYRPSFRRISDYNTFAHLAHTLVEEDVPDAAGTSQSTLLRKYDEGARDRQRVDLLLQFTPWDSLTTSLSGGYRQDDYIDSVLGLQRATEYSAGFDFNWMVAERASVYGGYVYERIIQRQRSRNRDVCSPPTVGCPAPNTVSDFSDWDWVTKNADTVNTVHLGASVGLIPRVLDWKIEGSWAYARGRVDTANPAPPQPHPGFPSTANATARTQPPFEDQLVRIDTALRYRFLKAWTASLSYAWEAYQKNDFRTETLNPFIPGQTSVWLGNDLMNYSAHILALTLRYEFR